MLRVPFARPVGCRVSGAEGGKKAGGLPSRTTKGGARRGGGRGAPCAQRGANGRGRVKRARCGKRGEGCASVVLHTPPPIWVLCLCTRERVWSGQKQGEGRGCFPRLEMIHRDVLSRCCLPLFYLLYFTFFITMAKKNQRKRSLNLRRGKRPGPWYICEKSKAVEEVAASGL